MGPPERADPAPADPARAPTLTSLRPSAEETRINEDLPPGLRSQEGMRGPAVGQILKSRYRLEERIGKGGMSTVFRATDLEAVRLGRGAAQVAIKVLTPQLGSQEAVLFDEVQKTRRLQQENMVDVYGFEPDLFSSFMVMELLSGGRLIAS